MNPRVLFSMTWEVGAMNFMMSIPRARPDRKRIQSLDMRLHRGRLRLVMCVFWRNLSANFDKQTQHLIGDDQGRTGPNQSPRQLDARRDYCCDAPASAAGACAFRPARRVTIPIATGTTPTATAVVPSSLPRASITTPMANHVMPALTSIVLRSCLRRDSRHLVCGSRGELPPTVRLRLSRRPGHIADQ